MNIKPRKLNMTHFFMHEKVCNIRMFYSSTVLSTVFRYLYTTFVFPCHAANIYFYYNTFQKKKSAHNQY